MKFVVLPGDDFTKEYHKAFQKLNRETEADKEQFRDQVFTVQGAVEDALKAKWEKQDDFEVAWDFVYSDRVFCKAYVETIGNALKSVDPEGRWTYHTVCEIDVNPAAKTIGESIEDRGELFVRGGTCCINGSKMKRDWRARLGCPD